MYMLFMLRSIFGAGPVLWEYNSFRKLPDEEVWMNWFCGSYDMVQSMRFLFVTPYPSPYGTSIVVAVVPQH